MLENLPNESIFYKNNKIKTGHTNKYKLLNLNQRWEKSIVIYMQRLWNGAKDDDF